LGEYFSKSNVTLRGLVMLVNDEKIKIDFLIIDSEGNLVFEKIGKKEIIFRFFA